MTKKADEEATMDVYESRIAALEATIADVRAKLAQASPEPYVPRAYPAMRYHEDGATRVIQSKAEEDAAWSDTPPKEVKADYPLYMTKDGARILVESAAARAALGDGWTVST